MELAVPECSQNHFNFQSSSLAPPQRNKALEIRQVTDLGGGTSPKFLPPKLGGGHSQFPAGGRGCWAGLQRQQQHPPWGVGASPHGVVVGGSHSRVGVDGFVQGLLPQLHAKGVQLHRGGYTVCRKTNRKGCPAATRSWHNLNPYCWLTAGKNELNFCHTQYLKRLNSKQNC